MSKSPGQVIVDRINKTRRQVLRVELATTLVTLAVCLVAYLLVASVFDHWVFRNGLPLGLRYVFLIAGACAALVYFVFRMVPLFRYPVNPAYAADVLEQWHSGMKNRLVNWVFLKRETQNINVQVERQVIDRIGQETLRNLNEIPDQLLVDCSTAIRWAIIFVVIFALFCAYTIFSPKNALQSSVRAMMPFLDVDVPQGITIKEVNPGDVTVYQGDVIQVTARTDRSTKLPVHLVYSTNNGRYVDQRVPMQDSGDGYLFECRFPPGKKGFEESLRYHLEVGGSRSKEWSVTVKPSIAIDIKSVEYRFPDYTKLAPQKIDGGGDIRAVEGTEVTVAAKSNVRMSRAALVFDNDVNRMMPLEISGDDKTVATGKFSLGFDPHHSEKPVCTSYALRCWDEDRRDNPVPSQYRVEVIRDAAPLIAWANKVNESVNGSEPAQIPLNQPFDVAVTAEDPDFGLQHVQLKGTVTRVKQAVGVRVGNAPPETSDLPLEMIELLKNPPRAGKITLKITLVPAKLLLQPGDRVSYFAEAVDTKKPDPNTSATSPRFFVVTDPDRNQPQNPNVNDQPREENNGNGSQEKQENSQQKQDSQKDRGDKNNNGNDAKNDKDNDSAQKPDQKDESSDPQKEDSQQKNKEQKNKGQKNEKQKDDVNRNDQKGEDDRQNRSGGRQSSDQKGTQDKETQDNKEQSANGKNDSGGKGKQDSSNDGKKSNNGAKSGNGPDGGSGSQEQGSQEQNNQRQPNGNSQQQGTGNQQTTNESAIQQGQNADGPDRSQTNSNTNGENRSGQNQDSGQQKQNGDDATGNTGKQGNGRDDGRNDSSRREKPVDGESHPGEVIREALDQMQKSKQASDSAANPSKPDTPKSDSSKQDSLNNDQQKASNQPPDSPPENMPDRHDNTQTTDRTDFLTAKEGNDPNAQNVDPSTDKKVFQDKNDQGAGSQEADGEGHKLDGNKFEGTQSGHHGNEKAAGSDEKTSGRSNPSDALDAKTGSAVQQQPEQTSQQPADQQPNRQPEQRSLQKGVTAENGTGQNGAVPPQDHSQHEKQPLDHRTPNAVLPTDQKPNKPALNDDGMPQHQPQSNPPQNQQQERQSGQDEKASATNGGGAAQTGDGGGISANRQNNRPSDLKPFQNQPLEEANLEYTKKATSLAVEYLENELTKEHPNQQLLDRLGWNRDDLQKFVDRWKRMQRQAENAPDDSKEAKRWDELLKNVGRLAPKSTVGERRDAQYRVTTTTAESHHYAPPKGSKYEQRTKAYTESVGIGEQGGSESGK